MKYVVANWKMNLGVRESIALARGVLRAIQGHDQLPQIVVCPSATALSEVHKLLTRSHVLLGAQNAGPDKSGAFTGEIGLSQLDEVGCTFVIVGHSERRVHFHETDAVVAERLRAVVSAGLTPILCVGEPKDIRDSGKETAYVLRQLSSALADLKLSRNQKLLVAYEPIWAIGSGTPAALKDVLVMHESIRKFLQEDLHLSDERFAVLYGGSIEGKNAYQFLRESEVDGLLVGGASLKINEFTKILEAACDVVEAQASV
ncbi:MAG: triosephosphate isomerase [Patescibacteria group bacterium]|jgi:triosephosphate isomerase|nr:triosephosphate isomerase [Patescibacteria group bacterium]